MNRLMRLYARLPQNVRDAVGRFVKIVSAAAVAAAGAAVIKAVTNGQPIDASQIGAAVAIAVVSAVEKYFNVAPRVVKRVKRKHAR